MASCSGWNFEMGAWVRACRCRVGRDLVASAFVEQEGRRWSTILSLRPNTHSRWKQLSTHYSPSEKAAKKYGNQQLRTHVKRVCG